MARADADRPGQPLGAAGAGHHPDPDLRLAELGVVAGDDQVAGHRQLAAAAEGEAADRGDEREPDRPDPVPGRRSGPRRGGARGLVGELDDVGAGREGPVAGAGEDDDPRPTVAVELLERVGQLGEEREAQRVAGLGPIDRDERDAVVPSTGASTRMKRVVGTASVTLAPRGSSSKYPRPGSAVRPVGRTSSVGGQRSSASSRTRSVASPGAISRRFRRRPHRIGRQAGVERRGRRTASR